MITKKFLLVVGDHGWRGDHSSRIAEYDSQLSHSFKLRLDNFGMLCKLKYIYHSEHHAAVGFPERPPTTYIRQPKVFRVSSPSSMKELDSETE